MSKKGICILNAYDILPGAEHFYERMSKELSQLSISLEKKTNAEIFTYLNSKGELSGEALDADFILYLDKDLYASYGLENRGYRLFNRAKAIELCDDKMRTHMALAGNGILMPKTISAPLNYSLNSSPEFVENVEKELSYPLVAKENFGSLGAGFIFWKTIRPWSTLRTSTASPLASIRNSSPRAKGWTTGLSSLAANSSPG